MAGRFQLGSWLVQPDLNTTVRDGKAIHLTPKVMGVLVCLAEHAGNPVSKEQLLQTVWPDTFVTDDVLKGAISELRRTFGDDAHEPRIIQTIPKRGYRLIAAVEPVASQLAPAWSAFRVSSLFDKTKRHLVGRGKERAELTAAFDSVKAGHGMLICVAGEPGIGKTTLVEDFLCDLYSSGRNFLLARGRCSERLAGSEAYLPFLEALGSLCCTDSGRTRATLRKVAPSWYAHLFPLSENDPFDAALQAHARTTTQEKVKRELGAFLEDVARLETLILFFDDLHWADSSTIDLLAYLATKFDSVGILVIAAYRPSELFLVKHPFISLKRDLQARTACREINVELLSSADVERYIALEFPENCFPREFAGIIHSRTEGNPLFMVDLLRYMRDQNVIVRKEGEQRWCLAQALPDLSRDFPQSARSMIERKIDQVDSRDREVLVTAAVEGYDFDSAAVARALKSSFLEIEEILERLDRIHALVKRGAEEELPDGTLTLHYRFVHILYQNALYASLTPTRRAVLSAALAHALEALYGDCTSIIVSKLGFLYETARDSGRASDYFLVAAQNAAQIFANQEAIVLARHGLGLLGKISETPERTRKELDLQITLAFSFLYTRGYAAPETGAEMARARELCRILGDTASLFPIIFGLWLYSHCKGELSLARETAEHMSSHSRNLSDPALKSGAHLALGFTLHHQGELVASRQQFEEAIQLYDVGQHGRHLQLYRIDLGLYSASGLVRTLWLLGFPDQARKRMDETLALARALSSPMSLAFCQLFTALLYQNLRQPEKTREIGEACIALCDEQAIQVERAWVMCPYGWALAKLGQIEEGIAYIRSGLDTQLLIVNQVARPQCLAIFIEALWHAGRTREALEAVHEGLAVSERNGERYYEAELWRLKGEVLLMQGKTTEAESCFQQALEIARQQAAKSFELRASTSLARLWLMRGKRKEAHQLLRDIYAWFTEGFDTADLKEAASLLEELS